MADLDYVPGSRRLRRAAAVATLVGASVALTGQAGATNHPRGSACGYYTDISFFGGPSSRRGCDQTEGPAAGNAPSVTLPPGGTDTLIDKVDANGAIAQYGPAVIFSGQTPPEPPPPSGRLRVTTTGTTKVVSTASVRNVGPDTFLADDVSSRCVATNSGSSGTTTITNGVVVTATDAEGNPTETVNVPTSPPKNFTVRGRTNNGERFRIVFNQQMVAEDGTRTVNAVHQYLLGPIAVGDLVIAQTTCGN